jgi:hypothetical protein
VSKASVGPSLLHLYFTDIFLMQRVGWVERGETHRLGGVVMLERTMGFAALYPSYGLIM